MNKYLKAVFCVPLAGIKYGILKLERGKNFHGSFPAIVSPLTEITVEKHGKLRIGKNLKMHNGAKIRIRNGATVEIGDNFSMSNGCVLTAYESIKIGDNVMLGPNVLIYDHDHDYRAPGGIAAMKFKTSPVVVGSQTWIGANSIILRGTTLGMGSVVGGGTVVKGIFPDDAVLVQKRTTEVIDYSGRTSQNST